MFGCNENFNERFKYQQPETRFHSYWGTIFSILYWVNYLWLGLRTGEMKQFEKMEKLTNGVLQLKIMKKYDYSEIVFSLSGGQNNIF